MRWRGRPIFVVNRPRSARRPQDADLADQLSDPQSQQRQQPPYATNWHRSVKPESGVLVGICTHLGCIPIFYPQPSATEPAANWPGGYFCPATARNTTSPAEFSAAFPAPYNLPVPPYRFLSDTTLRVGENPPVRASTLARSGRFRWLLPLCRGGINSPLVGQRIVIHSGQMTTSDQQPMLPLRVMRNDRIADGIRLFEFRDVEGKSLPEFSAGAHIAIRTPNGLVRKYSLCNDPAERDRYVTAIKREAGRGGSVDLIDNARSGDTLFVSPPVNDFALPPRATDLLFIAGGIGITPFMAMIGQCGRSPASAFGSTIVRDRLKPRPFWRNSADLSSRVR